MLCPDIHCRHAMPCRGVLVAGGNTRTHSWQQLAYTRFMDAQVTLANLAFGIPECPQQIKDFLEPIMLMLERNQGSSKHSNAKAKAPQAHRLRTKQSRPASFLATSLAGRSSSAAVFLQAAARASKTAQDRAQSNRDTAKASSSADNSKAPPCEQTGQTGPTGLTAKAQLASAPPAHGMTHMSTKTTDVRFTAAATTKSRRGADATQQPLLKSCSDSICIATGSNGSHSTERASNLSKASSGHSTQSNNSGLVHEYDAQVPAVAADVAVSEPRSEQLLHASMLSTGRTAATANCTAADNKAVSSTAAVPNSAAAAAAKRTAADITAVNRVAANNTAANSMAAIGTAFKITTADSTAANSLPAAPVAEWTSKAADLHPQRAAGEHSQQKGNDLLATTSQLLPSLSGLTAPSATAQQRWTCGPLTFTEGAGFELGDCMRQQ